MRQDVDSWKREQNPFTLSKSKLMTKILTLSQGHDASFSTLCLLWGSDDAPLQYYP